MEEIVWATFARGKVSLVYTTDDSSSSKCAQNQYGGRADFAQLDHLVKFIPHGHTAYLESKTIAQNNKTEWLQAQTDSTALIAVARSTAAKAAKLEPKRKENIARAKVAAHHAKMMANKGREAQSYGRKVKLQEELQTSGGLWTTVAQMQATLVQTPANKQKAALKPQISPCRKLLHQTYPDMSVFNFSQKCQQHDAEKLKQNLTKLTNSQPEQANPPPQKSLNRSGLPRLSWLVRRYTISA